MNTPWRYMHLGNHVKSLWVAVAGILVGSVCHSQSATLDSDPPGTYIAVSGPLSVAGNTPLPIGELPDGEYQILVEGFGLPSVRGRFFSSGGGVVHRPWAAPASLFLPPGFVHWERGEKRAWVLGGAGAFGGYSAVGAQARVRNAQDKIDIATNEHAVAISEEAILESYWQLATARREMADEEEVRNLWLGYLGYTWLAAGIENVFLTPEPRFERKSNDQYMVSFKRAAGWKTGLMSALVPGAGQRSMGRSGRSNFFAGAVAVFAAGTITTQEKFLEARRKQLEAQVRVITAESEEELLAANNELRRAADNAEDKNIVRWAFFGATTATYLWNILDAIGLGGQARRTPVNLSVIPGTSRIVASARWEF